MVKICGLPYPECPQIMTDENAGLKWLDIEFVLPSGIPEGMLLHRFRKFNLLETTNSIRCYVRYA